VVGRPWESSSQPAGTGHFQTEVANLARNVRDCPLAEGSKAITLPGDPERRERSRRSREGVTLDEGTWKQLAELAAKLGVNTPAARALP
jgi:LDH2 family malate/lactate/ureidoglycolate dehydrogenase